MTDEAHEQIHVDAEPSRCFALASGFEDYPTWAKDVKQATVLARDDAGRGTRGRVPRRRARAPRALRPRLRLHRRAGVVRVGRSSRATCCARSTAATRSRPTARARCVDYDLRVDLSVPDARADPTPGLRHHHGHRTEGAEADGRTPE